MVEGECTWVLRLVVPAGLAFSTFVCDQFLLRSSPPFGNLIFVFAAIPENFFVFSLLLLFGFLHM